MKNYKIQITFSNQRPRAEVLISIFHFSLFIFHLSNSVASPLQIRSKSHFRDGTCKMVLQAIEHTWDG